MARGKSQELFDKMLADMETLIEQIGLTEDQKWAAHRMAEQLMLHAVKLRKEHDKAGVRRSVKTQIAALGMAAIQAATLHRTHGG
jgi:hypothetical protein